jgi:hypothetical protein
LTPFAIKQPTTNYPAKPRVSVVEAAKIEANQKMRRFFEQRDVRVEYDRVADAIDRG